MSGKASLGLGHQSHCYRRCRVPPSHPGFTCPIQDFKRERETKITSPHKINQAAKYSIRYTKPLRAITLPNKTLHTSNCLANINYISRIHATVKYQHRAKFYSLHGSGQPLSEAAASHLAGKYCRVCLFAMYVCVYVRMYCADTSLYCSAKLSNCQIEKSRVS